MLNLVPNSQQILENANKQAIFAKYVDIMNNKCDISCHWP